MISWMCITYRRKEYLPRIVEQFLLQDYKGEKEFVILNDDPDVNYVCDHPEIKIHNWDHRFRNMRTKFNAGISLCSGYAFVPVADDDLHAQCEMRIMIEALGDDKFLGVNGFWKQNLQLKSIKWIQEPIGGFYACRMDFFKEMGGYMEWCGETEEERSSIPLEKITRCKGTREITKVAPELFMGRVVRKGDYKELFVNKEDAFFTWVRGTDHSGWKDKDEDKYIVKERNPKIIKIGGNYEY